MSDGLSSAAGLIGLWDRGARHEQVAAELVRRINVGRISRWNDLPRGPLCTEFDVSEGTLHRAKQLLAEHRVLEVQGGRYVVIAEKGFLGTQQAAEAGGQAP